MASERLQKIIARAGVTSRRKAEVLITAGRIAVNDEIVRELGSTADPRCDRITLDGRPLFEEEKRYLLVNKPKGVLCALRDRFDRRLITDLLGDEVRERVFPAGRLDYNSEGLVLLTNDGDFMETITRPGRGVAKEYEVTVAGEPCEEDLRRLAGGVFLEAEPEGRVYGQSSDQGESQPNDQVEDPPEGRVDGQPNDQVERQRTLPCTIERLEIITSTRPVTRTSSRLRVTLHEGKKNQIRRMFALIDAPVLRLLRVAIGSLKLDDLQAGEYRGLTAQEVEALRREVQAREERNGASAEATEAATTGREPGGTNSP